MASNSTAGPFDRRLEATVTNPDPYFFGALYVISFEETLRSKSVPAQDKAEILDVDRKSTLLPVYYSLLLSLQAAMYFFACREGV